jgi:hypothetical protein
METKRLAKRIVKVKTIDFPLTVCGTLGTVSAI